MLKPHPQYSALDEIDERTNIKEPNSEERPSRSSQAESITDTYEKTSGNMTLANLLKSFLGLGILAAPQGFSLTGVIPAVFLIALNGSLNMVTISMQVRSKQAIERDSVTLGVIKGNKTIKSYAELGGACFGEKGRLFVAGVIATNQVLCCIGYIMFFHE